MGKFINIQNGSEVLKAKIVETEAYLPNNDQASHSFKGRTKRNNSLYLEGGHCYVHTIHKYYCLDIVADDLNIPGGVLIRAAEPIEGVEKMLVNRKVSTITQLSSGPGKLCLALGINKSFDAVDVTNKFSKLFITEENSFDDFEIVTTKRIGISKSTDLLLRFYIKNNPFISRK